MTDFENMPYGALMRLAEAKKPQAYAEIRRRVKNGERPKVKRFKKYDKLSELQEKILRLFSSAITGEVELKNTETIHINFTNHSAQGGWLSWMTLSKAEETSHIMEKISKLRKIIEEEKKESGLCRIYLTPVENKKKGWEGFKIRVDRGTRLVYTEKHEGDTHKNI